MCGRTPWCEDGALHMIFKTGHVPAVYCQGESSTFFSHDLSLDFLHHFLHQQLCAGLDSSLILMEAHTDSDFARYCAL